MLTCTRWPGFQYSSAKMTHCAAVSVMPICTHTNTLIPPVSVLFLVKKTAQQRKVFYFLHHAVSGIPSQLPSGTYSPGGRHTALEDAEASQASPRRLLQSMNTHSETHGDCYQESLCQGGNLVPRRQLATSCVCLLITSCLVPADAFMHLAGNMHDRKQ